MAPSKPLNRQRLIAPRVRSERAADRLLQQMRIVGSERVLPRPVWLAATQLPRVIAAENGAQPGDR